MASERALAALRLDATAAERFDALGIFLDGWFGAANRISTARPFAGPNALQAFHELLGGRAITKQNRLPPPARSRVAHDKLVFYVENQGVCEWATDTEGDDPPVYVRMNEHGAAWRFECAHVSTFVLGLVILEATYGAPFDASSDGIDDVSFRALTDHVAHLPISPWQSSRTSFVGGAGVIGFVDPNGPDFAVWLGAKTREPFEALEDLIAEWPHQNF